MRCGAVEQDQTGVLLRVAIQGEPGSNSHLAVKQALGEQEIVACGISAEVFECVTDRREADAAVLPIENSLHGAVVDHYDLLLEHDVAIVGEVSLRIRHALIAVPGGALEKVRRVLSHPVALSQCRRFFLGDPALQALPFYATAGAVKHLLGNGDQDAAAIAAPFAAEVYGGEVLLRDLEDDPQNFTRFFVLVRAEDARHSEVQRLMHVAGAGEEDDSDSVNKMSVAFAIPHRPGSLVTTLQRLAEAGADLTRIESRPVPGRPWEYVFFVDLRVADEGAARQIEAVLAAACSMVKVLGRYRAAS